MGFGFGFGLGLGFGLRVRVRVRVRVRTSLASICSGWSVVSRKEAKAAEQKGAPAQGRARG